MRGDFGADTDRFDRCTGTVLDRLEGRAAYGADDLLSFGYLDRDDRVACIDGPLEAARAEHGHDVADLGDTEQRSHPGQQIPPEGGGWCQDAVVAGCQCKDLRREHRSQCAAAGLFNQQHALHAGELPRFCGDRRAGCGEYHHIRTGGFDLLSTVQATCRALLDVLTVVFADDEDPAHADSPRSRSAASRAGTSFTTMPLPRGAGASCFRLRN